MAYTNPQGFKQCENKGDAEPHQTAAHLLVGTGGRITAFFHSQGLHRCISPAVLVMMFLMLPLFMFAMYEKHGQPLEVILKNYGYQCVF